MPHSSSLVSSIKESILLSSTLTVVAVAWDASRLPDCGEQSSFIVMTPTEL